MKNFDFSKLDCFYADLRVERVDRMMLHYKNGVLENYAPESSVGAFLRVYNKGKWFYKSTTQLDQLETHFQDLIDQSQHFSGTCQELFADVPKGHDRYLRFLDQSPAHQPLEEKKRICESYFGLKETCPELKELHIFYSDLFQHRSFASSRGRSFEYDFAHCGMFHRFELRDGEHRFRDGYRIWGQDLNALKNHWEPSQKFILEGLRHLYAKPILPGKYPVLMNSEVVGVFAHESFGHKSEADAMIGDEAAQKEWVIGQKVASESVSIYDYGGDPDNSGYCPVDDEGFPTQKTYLIKNGILQGRLHSLATSKEFDERPTGNARAMNFEFEPIVRMTNTVVEPGNESFESMVSRVKEGIYVCNFRHGSGLSTFTIAPTSAYWIRDGKIAEPVKVSVISGDVFKTLNLISAVGSDLHISSSSFGGCGKDEQSPLRVGDGGPTILVDEMQVG